MKKVKKMALGGMGARTQSQMQASVPRTQAQMQATQRGGLSSKNASQAFQSAGMNVNLPTGQRGFSSSPTMRGVSNQLKSADLNIQKINTSPPPPGTPALQRFSTPEQYKQAEAAYKQMQQQQQLVNSIGRLPQANDLGQVGSQLTRTISGSKPSPAAPMRRTPTDLINQYTAQKQYNAQKSGVTGTGSRQTRTEPSLNDMRRTIKAIAGPIGTQLQSARSQRALPANPMKKGGEAKKYTKGGKINLDACSVSTAQKSKSSPKW